MSLKIIGPGFGRTGTHSLKLALERLGFGPCHHMWEVRDHPEQLGAWQEAARGKMPDWDRVFEGYAAQVDWPGARYWRELVQHFHDAKVILTVRSEQSWYDSMLATIGPFMWNHAAHPSPRMRARAEMTFQIVEQQIFHGRLKDRNYAIAVFRRHITDVQSSIPTRRLLTYDVSEGWDRLCNFLEVSVPMEPFPYSNSRCEFLRNRSIKA